MKILLIAISFIFSRELVCAQTNIKLTSDSDTAFWYKYKNDYAARFNLGNIENDTFDYSFRFWSHGLAVKLNKKDARSYGEITRFVEEYPRKKSKRIFKKQYQISQSNTKRLIELIDSLRIKDLPSDKNIKGWDQGFDGITYFIDYRQAGQYSFKNYWTPSAQDSLKEAKQLLDFISLLTGILDLNNNYKSFEAGIPFNGWTYPGSASAAIRVNQKSTKKKNGS